MAKLIAKRLILYQNRIYECGAELPANAALAPIWVENDAAFWKEDTGKKPKAVAVTAPAGISGDAVPATDIEPDLVGRVPSPKAQGAVKETRRRAKKKPT